MKKGLAKRTPSTTIVTRTIRMLPSVGYCKRAKRGKARTPEPKAAQAIILKPETLLVKRPKSGKRSKSTMSKRVLALSISEEENSEINGAKFVMKAKANVYVV